MSVRSLNRQQRVEQIANQIAAVLHDKYTHITTEIVYDPPDGVSAWVRIDGARDLDELEEIADSVLPLEVELLEQEGILVLAR
jgi:hypothetical protein